MIISKRSLEIEPSLTRELFNKAKEYDAVVDLTLGDPDLNTPIEIKKVAKSAIDNNMSHYSANAGLLDARNAVSKNINNKLGIKYDPTSEVMLTVGGMEGLFLALSCLLNEDDEVILLAPYYVNYYQMTKSCLAKPIIVDTYVKNKGIVIDKDKIEKSITNKTRLIIINSPNNPTGDTISKDDLKKILDLAIKYDLTIVSDEVYRSLIYDGIKHESVLQFSGAKERTVLVDSLSKEFCMTGWRIGYVAAPSNLIKEMVKMQENVAACANLISQVSLIEAYSNEKINKKYIISEFEERRNYFYNRINKINGVSCLKPKGTFYFFLDIGELGMDSISFAYDLLEKKHVAVVPGEAYGVNYKNYVRIAFTRDIKTLTRACDLLEEYVNEKIREMKAK